MNFTDRQQNNITALSRAVAWMPWQTVREPTPWILMPVPNRMAILIHPDGNRWLDNMALDNRIAPIAWALHDMGTQIGLTVEPREVKVREITTVQFIVHPHHTEGVGGWAGPNGPANKVREYICPICSGIMHRPLLIAPRPCGTCGADLTQEVWSLSDRTVVDRSPERESFPGY